MRIGRYIWLLVFVLLMYLCSFASVKYRLTLFLGVLAFGYFLITNVYFSLVSAFRFDNPNAKYVNIKSKFLKNVYFRPISIKGVRFANEKDERINVLGFVLNVINFAVLLISEIILWLPRIPCAEYILTISFKVRKYHFKHWEIPLYSVNEVIAAELPQYFMLAAFVLTLILLCVNEYKVHKREKKKRTTPLAKPFVKNEWHSPLYFALIDISVRRNEKKLKFWYSRDQLDKIDAMVKEACENAELLVERKGDRPISFAVNDKLNDRIVFRGYFT